MVVQNLSSACKYCLQIKIMITEQTTAQHAVLNYISRKSEKVMSRIKNLNLHSTAFTNVANIIKDGDI